MEETSRKSSCMRPMTLAEMMPNLCGILPESEILKLTARKAVPRAAPQPHTTGKDFRPCTTLTMAQLCAALKPKPTPARGRAPPSVAKKWNTSTKCENKKVSHTANAGSKQFTARKILNFQPVNKTVVSNIPRPSLKFTFATPKRLKPDRKMNKVLKHLQATNNVRISGVFDIQETPATTRQSLSRTISDRNNKENIPERTGVAGELNVKEQSILDESFTHLMSNNKKAIIKPCHTNKSNTITKEVNPLPLTVTTPKKTDKLEICTDSYVYGKTNNSQKTLERIKCNKTISPLDPSPTNSQGNSEQSFLEQEKEIYNETVKDSGVPLVSTPFKLYRNVPESFNESSDFDNSYDDTTAMNVEKASFIKANGSKEESDIISLCDLMDNAKLTYDEKEIHKYEIELLKMKNELQDELFRLKEQQKFVAKSMKRNAIMLKSVNTLLQLNSVKETKRVAALSTSKKSTIVCQIKQKSILPPNACADQTSPIKCQTFIRRVSKSPSYNIPKKSPCMRKKLLYKSVPLGLDKVIPVTPVGRRKSGSTAMTMYLKMKEQCNFLMTPLMNKTLPAGKVANTPAVTSLNLQNQLKKLYNETP